ncbi:MAG: hypothetical protein ACW99A_06630 [Candidatus Kariarchaeaceae archaeon]|jgi:predicted transcriptional regulator
MNEDEINQKSEILKPLEELSGVRLRVFCYLLKQNEPVGVRETQRSLGLKTASHANYHLQKLVELKMVKQTPQNSYYLLPDYKIKSIRVNVLTDYLLIRGKFWPRTVFFASYLFFSLIIALILSYSDSIQILKIYGFISLVVSLIVTIFEVRRQLNALPWENEKII